MVNDKPVAIILGGTYPHKKLIHLLKRRGYYTVLVDYLEYSPAMEDADEHIRESTLDKEKVLDIARKLKACLIISTCIDQANVTACYVGEELGLPIPYSYRTALSVTDKIKMKSLFMLNNIPTAAYSYVSNVDECDAINLKYPLIVKPSDSNSSKGVVRVENPVELKHKVAEAISISRNSQAIIEEFIEGIEIAFDAVVHNNKVDLILSRERCKLKNTSGLNQQISGSIWPARISPELENKYRDVIRKISEAFNLKNTPLIVQSIFNGKNIYIIEFAPRIGGGENYSIIELLTGCDLIDIAIDSFLNKKLQVSYHKPTKYVFDNYLYVREGVFNGLIDIEDFERTGIVDYYRQYKRNGSLIGPELSSNNRVGVITISGKTVKELNDKRKLVFNNIKITDIGGNSILRSELYLNELI